MQENKWVLPVSSDKEMLKRKSEEDWVLNGNGLGFGGKSQELYFFAQSGVSGVGLKEW